MLTQTIGSYPYQQYADDDDVRAFFDAFNNASQQQVDDFNSLNLPYYPGLTGDLLNWVAEGLYGLTRTALETPPTAALGPLNTEALNTAPLNSYVAPTETYYSLSDDIFQRILTWDFFKGDGKRFCMRWLKRRIMRFLVGANGIDPEPWNPGFVIGAENTSAISVQVSSGTLTVTINQALISSQVQLVPNILTLFQLAFEGNQLEIPAQYTSLVVNIETTLVAMVSPLSESAVGSTSSITTGAAVVSVADGSGEYTYSWAWTINGANLTINSPAAESTTFTADLPSGGSAYGTATCTVTDTITTKTATVSTPVNVVRGSAPTAVVSPASLSALGTAPSIMTGVASVTVTDATPFSAPFTFAWSWVSGGTGITINSPTQQNTTFTGVGVGVGDTLSGTAQCLITDTFFQTTTITLPVSIERAASVGATISSGTASSTGAGAVENTPTVTVTASGGVAPYTYSWAWQSGGANIAIETPAAASTFFSSGGMPPSTTYSGTAVCTVKDSLGQSAQVTCSVTLTRVSLVTASVAPTTESSSGPATTQTTGFSAVTASGGSGAYTYAWGWASGGSHIAINSPSSYRTSFTGSAMVPGTTYTGVARCTVTDGYGQIATVTVSVSITCANLYDGTLIAGDIGSGTSQYVGYQTGEYGSLAPVEDQNGNTIATLVHWTSGNETFLYIEAASDPTQSYFGSLIIGSTTLTAASATYGYSGGQAAWIWTGGFIGIGDTYAITLTRP